MDAQDELESISDRVAHLGGMFGVAGRHRKTGRRARAVVPTQQQYREINFQIDGDRIDYIEVSDPGRCIMGELTRQSAQPGQCIERVDIPDSPFVRLIKGAG